MSGVFHNGVPEKIPTPFNMAAYVLRRADELSDKTALEVHQLATQQNWTFREIAKAVREVAAGLHRQGIEPDDLVLLRLGNTVEFPIVFLGCLWAGCIPVPTSAALTQREVDWIAQDLSPRLCIGQDPLPLPRNVVCRDPQDLHLGEDMAQPVLGDPERLGYVIYTSGSSGQPRAVAHAHRAIWARRMMYQGWYGLTEADRVFHAGAFNWTYTLGVGLMDPWAQGATAIVREDGLPDPTLPTLLHKSKASIFAAAPGVYRQMLNTGETLDMPDLRHGLSAGEALPKTVRAAWRTATGTEIYEALGMSECSTYISAHPGRQAPDGCAGFVQNGRCVTVLDEQGAPQPFGAPGTLAIHRSDPGLMLGYLNAPEATHSRMRDDWFDTGDRAVLSADGAVQYLGRNDDMMNAGGFRVSPLEVEAVFAPLPGLAECAAIEVEEKSEAHVIALLYTGQLLDESRLKAHAEASLARYKQPRLYRHCETLPRNANGKLNRKALRAQIEVN